MESNNDHNNHNDSLDVNNIINYIIDNNLCGYDKTWEGDLIFASEQHYCIYCHKPIDIYKVEYLIMGPLDEQKWPTQAAKEKAIPKDEMPILIKKYWNKDRNRNDADFVCSSKCYEVLQRSKQR